MPTWTPAHFEFGFAAASSVEPVFSQNAVAGTPASASLPNSRREYSIDALLWKGYCRPPASAVSSALVQGRVRALTAARVSLTA